VSVIRVAISGAFLFALYGQGYADTPAEIAMKQWKSCMASLPHISDKDSKERSCNANLDKAMEESVNEEIKTKLKELAKELEAARTGTEQSWVWPVRSR
jgi:hypothetical protein